MTTSTTTIGPSVVSRMALIAVNLIPLVGVVAFDWDLGVILLLYWAETAVIGLFAILRLFLITPGVARFFLVPFFCVHMGGFMMGHYVFLNAMVLGNEGAFRWPSPANLAADLGRGGLIALAGFAVSHAISHIVNFLQAREHEGMDVTDAMTAPYRRIVVMHIAIVAAGFAVVLLGSPVALLAILVLGKIVLDLRAHTEEHRRLQRAAKASEVSSA